MFDRVDYLGLVIAILLCVSAYMNGGWRLLQWCFIGGAIGYWLALRKADKEAGEGESNG